MSSWDWKKLGRAIPLPVWPARVLYAVVGALALVVVAGPVINWWQGPGLYPDARQTVEAAVDWSAVESSLSAIEAPPPPQPAPYHRDPAPRPWREGYAAESGVSGAGMTAANDLAAAAARDKNPVLYGNAGRAYTEVSDSAWRPLFNAGVMFLEAAEYDLAIRRLTRASTALTTRLGALDAHAARAETYYALAVAQIRKGDCVNGLWSVKRGISELQLYVDTDGSQKYSRERPFPLRPGSLHSYDFWRLLVHGYMRCGEDYPRNYEKLLRQGTNSDDIIVDFLKVEYPSVNDEVLEGPFPAELSQCIEQAQLEKTAGGGKAYSTARCWALANLNRISRSNPGLRDGDHVFPILAHNIAWMAATSGNHKSAARFVDRAQELYNEAKDQAKDPDPELGQAIGELRAYVEHFGGFESVAGSALASDFAAVDLSRAGPDEVWPVADRLTERWRRLIAEGRAEDVEAEYRAQVAVSGPLEAPLTAWKLKEQDALLAGFTAALDRAIADGDVGLLLALRDFRADYLGEAWSGPTPRRISLSRPILGAWIEFLAPPVLTFAVLALGHLLAIGLNRAVVYPYLLYTTDYYSTEYRIRRRAAKRAHVAFDPGDLRAELKRLEERPRTP